MIAPDRLVADEIICTLIEAARVAPSCSNNEPWYFIACRGKALNNVKSCLTRGNAWALNAPLVIAVASKPELGCQRDGRDYYSLDMGLAVENCLLQGIHLGLVMHPIAGFDELKLKSVLAIPDDYRIFVCIVIGYPGVKAQENDNVREADEEKTRKSLNEILFWEGWGRKADQD